MQQHIATHNTNIFVKQARSLQQKHPTQQKVPETQPISKVAEGIKEKKNISEMSNKIKTQIAQVTTHNKGSNKQQCITTHHTKTFQAHGINK